MKDELMTGWDLAQKIATERKEEKMQREFVSKLITEFSDWKDSKIAEFVGVENKLVKEIRSSLKKTNR